MYIKNAKLCISVRAFEEQFGSIFFSCLGELQKHSTFVFSELIWFLMVFLDKINRCLSHLYIDFLSSIFVLFAFMCFPEVRVKYITEEETVR